MSLLSIASLWQTNRTLVILIGILIVVIPFLVYYLNQAKKYHPKGLIAAALSNMGERFGYYIMNAILLLFLVSNLVCQTRPRVSSTRCFTSESTF